MQSLMISLLEHAFEQTVEGPVKWLLPFWSEWNCSDEENHVDGLMLEKRNFIVNALELRLSCTNPMMW